MEEVYQRLFSTIQESGMSYGELSEKTGIPKTTIYRYATGDTSKLPMKNIEKLAMALGVSAAYLMCWTDDKYFQPAQKDEPEMKEFIRLFSRLSQENQKRILDLMIALLEGQVK